MLDLLRINVSLWSDMFKKGQPVICVENKDNDNCGSILEKNKVYYIEEYISPEDCKRFWPQKDWWPKNGGKVVLKEFPKLEWFARRFEAIEEKLKTGRN